MGTQSRGETAEAEEDQENREEQHSRGIDQQSTFDSHALCGQGMAGKTRPTAARSRRPCLSSTRNNGISGGGGKKSRK